MHVQEQSGSNPAGEIMRFAARKLGRQIEDVWWDFHLGEPRCLSKGTPRRRQWSCCISCFTGIRQVQEGQEAHGDGRHGWWPKLENAGRLSEMESQILEQAMRQLSSFYEAVSTEPERASTRVTF